MESVLASDFATSKSTVSRAFHSIIPVSAQLLKKRFVVPVHSTHPDLADCVGFVDGTCQQHGAPKDKARYKLFACGHHGSADIKSLTIHCIDGKCMFVAAGFPGSFSELKIFLDQLRVPFLTEFPSPPNGLIADSGYQVLGKLWICCSSCPPQGPCLDRARS